jgi:hypothetical protein
MNAPRLSQARATSNPTEFAHTLDGALLPPAMQPADLSSSSFDAQTAPLDQPRIPTPAEALDLIYRTLPAGVELHRPYHYVIPLGKREKLDLLILKIYCPDEVAQRFNEWRVNIADEIDPVVMLVLPVRGTQHLWNNLKNRFPDVTLLTDEHRPTIQSIFNSVCGERPQFSIHRVPWDMSREDLTAVPFIAPDRPGVQDIEDLIHGERKPDGSYIWRTAIVDVTDYVKPGNALDSQAMRVGSTLRARRRSIPTLPEELAHDLVSFREGEIRPAWVLEGRLTPDREDASLPTKRGTHYRLHYQVRRAYVRNHKSIDPSNIPPLQLNSPLARSLSALSEVARILRHRRASKPTPIRVEGTGALDMITAELMIESNHLLTEYIGSRKGLPLCYSVHEKPSKATKERLHRQLRALGVPNSVEQFDKPSELTGIIYGLERMRGQASQALKKDIIDHFLLRSLLSADNHGHYGLRLQSYAAWKPREAAGIANQLQLAATFGLHAPLSYTEMARRANVLNEKRWKKDERTFSAILLESLYHKLSLVGSITTGTVTDIAHGKVMVSMAGFSRLATLRGVEMDSNLEVGAPVVGVFRGFNLNTKEYEFELA